MAKFCTYCGSPLEENAVKCASCGVKTENASEETVEAAAEEARPAPTPTPAVQPVQAAPAPLPEQYKVASTAFYFWMTLVFALPFVGFIASIIGAIGYKNKNKKNFSKAFMWWYIVAAVISVLTFIGLLIIAAIMGAGIAELIASMAK